MNEFMQLWVQDLERKYTFQPKDHSYDNLRRFVIDSIGDIHIKDLETSEKCVIRPAKNKKTVEINSDALMELLL